MDLMHVLFIDFSLNSGASSLGLDPPSNDCLNGSQNDGLCLGMQ